MISEDSIISWTIRIAVLLYGVRVIHDSTGLNKYEQWVRIAWTAGCVFNLLHLAAAFYWFHELSHNHAYNHTAQRTANVTGINWGGGIYINYLFTAFWLFDSVLWWRNGVDWPYSHRGYLVFLHSVFAFIIFNATAVFGPYFWKYIIVLLYLIAICAYFKFRKLPTDNGDTL